MKINLLPSSLITNYTKDLLYSQTDIENTLYLVKEKGIKNIWLMDAGDKTLISFPFSRKKGIISTFLYRQKLLFKFPTSSQ